MFVIGKTPRGCAGNGVHVVFHNGKKNNRLCKRNVIGGMQTGPVAQCRSVQSQESLKNRV